MSDQQQDPLVLTILAILNYPPVIIFFSMLAALAALLVWNWWGPVLPGWVRVK